MPSRNERAGTRARGDSPEPGCVARRIPAPRESRGDNRTRPLQGQEPPRARVVRAADLLGDAKPLVARAACGPLVSPAEPGARCAATREGPYARQASIVLDSRGARESNGAWDLGRSRVRVPASLEVGSLCVVSLSGTRRRAGENGGFPHEILGCSSSPLSVARVVPHPARAGRRQSECAGESHVGPLQGVHHIALPAAAAGHLGDLAGPVRAAQPHRQLSQSVHESDHQGGRPPPTRVSSASPTPISTTRGGKSRRTGSRGSSPRPISSAIRR